MIKKTLTVLTRAGIHTRPASQIVKTAGKFKSEIFFTLDDATINAKSIMGIITLGAVYKTEIICTCEGEDENEQMAAIEDLFERRFEDE